MEVSVYVLRNTLTNVVQVQVLDMPQPSKIFLVFKTLKIALETKKDMSNGQYTIKFLALFI